MRMSKMCSLAAILVLCLSGSLWADSVKQSDVTAAFAVTTGEINQNFKIFESSKVLQSEYLTASLWDLEGLALWAKHDKRDAEADFAAAINQLKLVAGGLTPSTAPKAPDAGSLSLLACSGLLLFGAMKSKFSR
jgi:hypothetical protein